MTDAININALAQEIHENAKAHGWWEEDRDFAEIIALVHSELSEALEKYRDGKPMVYMDCAVNGSCSACTEPENQSCRERNNKPEGIAVELADCVIRILDWYAKEQGNAIDTYGRHIWAQSFAKEDTDREDFGKNGICRLLASMHSFVAMAYEAFCDGRISATYENLELTIAYIEAWLKVQGINLWELVRIKHDYNKTRPYKHGGKVC